jgi:hypothetical protein
MSGGTPKRRSATYGRRESDRFGDLEAGFQELLDLIGYRDRGSFNEHFEAKVEEIVKRVRHV